MIDFQVINEDGQILDSAMVEFTYRGWQIAAVRSSASKVIVRAFRNYGFSQHIEILNSVESAIDFVDSKEDGVPTGEKQFGFQSELCALLRGPLWFIVFLYLVIIAGVVYHYMS